MLLAVMVVLQQQLNMKATPKLFLLMHRELNDSGFLH